MFEVKKPKYHSASSINSFITNRAKWFAERIRGVRGKAGVAAWRGTAVEAGMNYYINNGDPESTEDFSGNDPVSIEDAVKYALKIFTKESAGEDPSNLFDIRQSIAPCVKAGIESFGSKAYFERGIILQESINGYKLPGCRLPIYGKLDYVVGGRKIVDNKVVSKTPSSLKQDYVIQGAIYKEVRKLPTEFHFIIPLKKEIKIKEIILSKEEHELGINLAAKAAQAIETIFDNIDSLDGELQQALFFPDPDSFYTNKECEAVCNDVFGLDYKAIEKAFDD